MSFAPIIGNTQNKEQSRTLPANMSFRLKLATTALLTVIATLIFIANLVSAVNWRNTPFIGVMVSQTQVVTGASPTTADAWNGLTAGITPRMEIVAINGERLRSGLDYAAGREKFDEIMRGLEIGQDVVVDVKTPGGPTQTFTYPVQTFPSNDFLVFFIVPFMSGLITLAAAWLILIIRPSQPGAFTSVVVFNFLALFMVGLFDLGAAHTSIAAWYIATTMLGGGTIVLGLTFPSQLSLIYRYPILRFVPLVITGFVAIFAVINATNPPTPTAYFLSNQLAMASSLTGIALLIVSMLIQRRKAVSPRTRDQSGTVLLGLLLALGPGTLWTFGQVMQLVNTEFHLPFTLEAATPFLLTPVIAITYGLLEYHRSDSDQLLSKSITYGILLFTLILGYFLLVLGAGLIVADLVPNNPLLIAVTLFGISVLFLPIRGWLQSRVDAIYFRKRRNYQEQLEVYSQELNTLQSYDDIIGEFTRLINAAITPTNIFVFLPDPGGDGFVAYGKHANETNVRFASNSGLVKLLTGDQGPVFYLQPDVPFPRELITDRARLLILRPMVLAGLRGSEQLNGIVTLGAPRSNSGSYGYEEIRFVNAMIAQLSVAIERVQVIDNLENRLNELNVLSQVGDAVNYTIEFDDLLELIYAQTTRLISADYFYIALYDDANNQMFFAFLLEKDERFENKENVRWQYGNDVFSHIVRSGQSVRLTDYEKSLVDGRFEPVFETGSIKAFMGVPLIAQKSTLGVLAMARSTAEQSYNANQLKIFNNIGALAATSLDKARLFSQLNARARQLAALNDISSKLAAAEGGNVEDLLKLITSSAVSILEAEAGSLLLSVNEEKNADLEFKVVIGGTGGDLVGKHISSERGLVGEVVRSGRPQISNNTRQDQRWEGELTQSGFSTTSILAVPLIAKDSIIGVLEVLNKLDGTMFVEEDVELLTTFAGQAAIAIENARLFSMTEVQLSERLQELQTLEQIDRDLARELDIDRVARITIKWAVANSGATAAAIGLVDEARNIIYMRHVYGYRENEYPEGADGMRWPLDKGVVSRVLRTRQADLADPKIDPDYAPSLKGSTSQITVPMLSGEDIIAILILETNQKTPFNLIDMSFVQRLAERASIALANAQLYDEVRLAADTKSEFVGFAAHELKNPLTSIKGYAQALMSGMAAQMPEEMRQNSIQIIHNNAERMQGIIDDMRDIAKSDAGKFEMKLQPESIRDIAENSILPFQKEIEEKNQSVVNNTSDDLPQVLVDRQKLLQVMVNLLSNAHKYTPSGGTITVDASVVKNYRDPNGKVLGDMMHVMVSDTGIGMSEEDLNRIFREDYFRSDNSLAREQKGTGLGMIVTERIIQGHNGRIWVESELGVGTTFQFVVPVASGDDEDITDTGRESGRDSGIHQRPRRNIRATQSVNTVNQSESEPASD